MKQISAQGRTGTNRYQSTATGVAAVVGNGFVGTVAFTAPLTGLLTAVRHPVSRNFVGGYAAWVAYDLWWSYGLWKLNP